MDGGRVDPALTGLAYTESVAEQGKARQSGGCWCTAASFALVDRPERDSLVLGSGSRPIVAGLQALSLVWGLAVQHVPCWYSYLQSAAMPWRAIGTADARWCGCGAKEREVPGRHETRRREAQGRGGRGSPGAGERVSGWERLSRGAVKGCDRGTGQDATGSACG